jgi:alcohol dehydrogenase class IV
VATVVFEGVEPEPSLATVGRGRELLREAGCDVVVAVGGGSALDVGKAIGALANAAGALAEYHQGREIAEPGVPIIAVPTTAGTGSEVTPNAVLSDHERGIKASIRGDGVIATVALVDPELTLGLPPGPTGYAGLDAFTQALEGYSSVGANLVTDKLAEEALMQIAANLRTAYHEGSNVAAREGLSLGSLLAGMAFASSRLGLVHGLAHPVGMASQEPHGRVCGLLLPHVIRFNMEAAREKYARAARLTGISDEPDDGRAAQALERWVVELVAELQTGRSLSDLGIGRDDLEAMIAPALSSSSTRHNPRQVTEPDLREFLREIL